jgi:hypothetical protein
MPNLCIVIRLFCDRHAPPDNLSLEPLNPCLTVIGSIRKLCATYGADVSYDASIMNPESNPTRTLTLVLPEADWKALREAEPDAIGWLRAQIQNRLATPGGTWSSPAPATTAESWWGNEDEY